MKKQLLCITACASLMASAMPAFAEAENYQNEWDGMISLQKEIYSLPAFTEYIQYQLPVNDTEACIQLVIKKDGNVYELASGYSADPEAFGNYDAIDCMTVGICSEDGLYLNIGGCMELVTSLAEEEDIDSSEINNAKLGLQMIGLDKDWLLIPPVSGADTLADDCIALYTDMFEALKTCCYTIPAEAIEGGYSVTLDSDSMLPYIEAMETVYADHLEEWMDAAFDIVNKVDVKQAASPYVEAALAGIRYIDDTTDTNTIQDMINSQIDEVMQALPQIQEEAKNALPEILPEISNMSEAYEQAKDQVSMQVSYSIVKSDDGIYTIDAAFEGEIQPSVLEEIETADGAEEAEEALEAVNEIYANGFSVKGEIRPEAESIAVPEEYSHIYDVVTNTASMLWSMQTEGSDTDEPEDESVEFSYTAADPSTYLDGNRYLLSDDETSPSYWVSFNPEVLEIDPDYSEAGSIFLNVKDPDSYDYVPVFYYTYGSFAEDVESQKSYYAENYKDASTELIYEQPCSEYTLQIWKSSYTTEDGDTYSSCIFGVDMSENSYLTGEVSSYEASDEEIISWIQNAVQSIEIAE